MMEPVSRVEVLGNFMKAVKIARARNAAFALPAEKTAARQPAQTIEALREPAVQAPQISQPVRPPSRAAAIGPARILGNHFDAYA
jgi:hypothetical protein